MNLPRRKGGKDPSDKKLVVLGGSAAKTNIHSGRKREMQNCKVSFHSAVQ